MLHPLTIDLKKLPLHGTPFLFTDDCALFYSSHNLNVSNNENNFKLDMDHSIYFKLKQVAPTVGLLGMLRSSTSEPSYKNILFFAGTIAFSVCHVFHLPRKYSTEQLFANYCNNIFDISEMYILSI